ncbi:hydroxyacid dehydrogenase [Streptomyces aurantiacus]|uniref:Putative D-3-phosphoglycerate dehydrogenase n=1 Tax=Streptomyces aurantiacus JA 4570 TaxID=1286094 RepID=S4APE5_9ACTN|nr:hydroxyacid dehydrogenase [Streptomyces aurantiacus]EPH43347.1 putative D-3-phosphoglycerate dehydrogenase [Streptomyces aurantiacus JA 4570]
MPDQREQSEAARRKPVVALAMGADVVDRVIAPDLRQRLARSVELVPGPLTGELTGADARAVLGGVEVLVTGWDCPRLTAGVLAHAPRLRAVVHAAGSVKPVVTNALWDRGVLVSSAADANAGPVVAYTLAALTLAAKGALSAAAHYAERWPPFTERTGADARTIGVIGASRIGRRVIAALNASDAGHRVLLTDPYVTPAEAAALGADLVDLPDLCRDSGIVTVHAPQLPETRGLLSEEMLKLIPDGGVVVNTARGSLIDTEALARECAAGRLDAFLDVTDPEPLPPGHVLLTLPNVLVTPHIAGAQGSEVRRLGEYAVAEVERYARGEALLGALRREELGRLA